MYFLLDTTILNPISNTPQNLTNTHSDTLNQPLEVDSHASIRYNPSNEIIQWWSMDRHLLSFI